MRPIVGSALLVLGLLLSVPTSAQTTIDANGVFNPKGCAAAGTCAPSSPAMATAPRPVATGPIRTHCEKEWPTDFRMQAYCQKQAREAAIEMSLRTMTTADQRTIRTHCQQEWGEDLRMVNYCEKRQLDALRALGR
jgi:hypothetical protein